MYGLHQSSGGRVESKDMNSLEVVLKELKEEIELKIYHFRAK